MPAPLLVLALVGAAGFALSKVAKRNPATTGPTDGTIASGKPYIPAEAFSVISAPAETPQLAALVGDVAFTDKYGEIAAVKLLRYKVTSQSNQLLPGGGGQVKVVRAALTSKKSVASGGLPTLIDDTALGVVRGMTGAAIASRSLAAVPNGIPADALLFRTVMDDLRLFPDTVTIVIGDPNVIRTLATGSVTATNTALGVPADVAVVAADVSGLDLPTTTQELINSMAET